MLDIDQYALRMGAVLTCVVQFCQTEVIKVRTGVSTGDKVVQEMLLINEGFMYVVTERMFRLDGLRVFVPLVYWETMKETKYQQVDHCGQVKGPVEFGEAV